MYVTLVRGGIVGRKPKTSFRKLGDGVFIAAQPDLEDFKGYSEFKTYPLDDYARSQKFFHRFWTSQFI